MPRGNPTTVIRLPSDLLDRIDVDAERQHKAGGRVQWLTELAEAALSGRLVPVAKPSTAARPLVDRTFKPHPKPGAK
jgi:hypothetical protein